MSPGSATDGMMLLPEDGGERAHSPDAATQRDQVIGQLMEMQRKGELAPAIDHWKALLASAPNNPAMEAQLRRVAQMLNRCGVMLYRAKKIEDALACFLLSLRAQESYAPALYSNIAGCLWDLGRMEESDAAYRKALALRPDMASVHSSLLFGLHYKPEITSAQLMTAHKEWDTKYGAGKHLAPASHANARQPERLLRVGFVSPDLGQHPVGIFLIRYLENIDRNTISFVCYSTTKREGALTDRIRAVAEWHDVADRNDDELALKIHTDSIDILIDLSGHSADNRLGVFARKPAPVQIGWLGYPGDTGLAAMDYVIGDRFVLPETMELHTRARIIHLPDSFVCFDPPADAPPVSALPATTPGAITFGAFHNPVKCGPEVIELWSGILKQLPQSRLRLKFKGFGYPSTQQVFHAQFAAHGINAAQVEFESEVPLPQMLTEMGRIDLALDPFPFAGGLMTCYTLWMGVPLLTLPGESFASRQGLDFLTNIGITETIASSREDYIRKAVALAHDLPKLAELRMRMRPAMEVSPLCDGPKAAKTLEALLRKVWRDWCRNAA